MIFNKTKFRFKCEKCCRRSTTKTNQEYIFQKNNFLILKFSLYADKFSSKNNNIFNITDFDVIIKIHNYSFKEVSAILYYNLSFDNQEGHYTCIHFEKK